MNDERAHDAAVLRALRARDGTATTVRLRDGSACAVFNIAWGYDDGDLSAHVTTNVSPSTDGTSIDHFVTSNVVAIEDPAHPGADLLPGISN